MKNKFRLGLVAQIGDSAENLIMSKDWTFFMNFFKQKGEVILFDWKTLGNDFVVPRYVKGSENSLEIVEEKVDIRDLCDIVYIGQLGKIHQNRDSFMNFLNILEDFPGKVVNPISTIKANLSKQYLSDLQEKGVCVIPTLDVDSSMTIADLENLEFPNYGKSEDGIVLKPKVFGEQGSGVVKLEDFSTEEELKEYFTKSGEVIAQPLIKEIYTKGENSFIFTGKNFSHGLNKVTGNFKINMCESSKYTPVMPTEAEMNLCNAAFEALPNEFGYVRVDIIPGENPMIGEVEMVNPAGYLAEVDAYLRYSENLNVRLNEVFQRERSQWM